MNKITQDVCKWQDEAFVYQKREFDKRSHTRTFSAVDIVYVTRPHSGHLAQKFQPSFKGPFSIITQKSYNNYLLQDCVKANRTRSVHVNFIKHGTFREQLFDETVSTPLTDLEPPQQPAALLRSLNNLKSTRARNAHVMFTTTTTFFYETQRLLLLLRLRLQKTNRFKDRHFKGSTCICQRHKFLCQLFKKRSGPWWNLRQRVTIMNLKML
jgi:hypothetical protein